MSAVQIRPLLPEESPQAVRLLTSLNLDLPEQMVAKRFNQLLRDHSHYQAFGAFTEQKLIGIAGAWIATKVWCGRYLEIDNLVVDPCHRSTGVGSQLVKHLEKHAAEQECEIMVLDTYTSNHGSHRLYHRLGFEILGFHFVKSVDSGL